jgi:alkylation response protein AidB-like acyl-CoA dehydrogenase
MLGLALEHVSTREQFGRPLGRLQAVQNRLARPLS